MRHLHIDIETFSATDIKYGVYKYASDPEFEILLIGFAGDDEPTQVIDLASGQRVPSWFINVLQDKTVIKHAHNAAFERVCFSQALRRMGVLSADEWLDPSQWECSMVKAMRCGLPASLAQVGDVLGLKDQKMKEGKGLIELFCKPASKTKTVDIFGEDSTYRVRPEDQPESWKIFKEYCIRDVDVERDIERRLSWYKVSDLEKELYAIDQTVNDRGVLIDLSMAENAVKMDSLVKAHLSAEAQKITGLANPNSGQQLAQWLSLRLGRDVTSLTKEAVSELKPEVADADVLRVLDIRAEINKTSNKKYQTMLDMACSDGRARGLTQFYGSRTGRWAGRGVQLQNLPQNHIPSLEEARNLLLEDDYVSMELCYGNVPDTLSQLIRTAFIAKPGHTFAVCDFSAIEARVLAWIAGETWVLDVFRKGGDIYCATASQMFGVPVEKHGENEHLRQKGKVAVLALGYQGGKGALDKMGGKKIGMSDKEELETVIRWRKANASIVKLWKSVEDAVKQVTVGGSATIIRTTFTQLTVRKEGGTVTIELPSGRRICYPDMELHFEQNWAYLDQTPAQAAANQQFISKEKKSLHPEKYMNTGKLRFKGQNQETKKWEWVETYGGKLVENITQATARDCLALTMRACEKKGYGVCFHIHDELVMEVSEAEALESLKDIQRLFAVSPEWAKDLPLKGAGYITPFYKKD